MKKLKFQIAITNKMIKLNEKEIYFMLKKDPACLKLV